MKGIMGRFTFYYLYMRERGFVDGKKTGGCEKGIWERGKNMFSEVLGVG